VRARRLLLCFVVTLAACGGGGGDAVAKARRVLDYDGRFATAYDSGDALAKIGSTLLRAGKRCDGGGCPALLSASAYAQVLAVRVLDCTAPGRERIRGAMRAELDAIDELAPKAPAPTPPPIPSCG